MAKAIGTSWTTLKTYDWVPGTGFRASFYLEARYSSSEKNNIEGNYSNIYTRLRSVVHAGQGSGYGYNFTCSYAPTVSGSSQWFLGTEVITESPMTPIEHEDDGTKTITLTASGSISPIGLNFSISEDVVLDTIPRATTLLDQSGTIGHNITINWTPASDKFTHKLTYSFGSIKDEVLGTGLKKSFPWSIPAKLYKEFTGQSGKGTLKLTTYNGTTQIGSAQEVELLIYANQSFSEPIIVPEQTSIEDINSATIALTGDADTFILNHSKAFITLTFKTRNFGTLKSISVNGATVANNRVTAGTQSTDGTTIYGLEYEYGTLNTKQFVFRITDTRDYTIEHTAVLSDNIVINYVPLTAVTTFKRITPTGGKVGLVFNGNYFNGSFGAASNTLEISYKYKKSTDSTYTTVNLVNNTDYKISGNTYYSGTGSSKQTITLAPTFDYKSQYDVQVVIKDKLTTLPTINAIISKGIPIMWWNGEKVVVNGDLQIATSDGSVQTTIIDGNINTNGNMNIKADGTNIAYKQGGVPILRYNGTDTTLISSTKSIYFRPNGTTNSTGQVYIDSTGVITTPQGKVATVNDIKEVYSNTETVVGTYFGKPLYKKSFSGSYANDINILTSVKKLVDVRGSAEISGVYRTVPYYELYNSKVYCATFQLYQGNVLTRFYSNGNTVTSNIDVTFYYTKTTD